MKYFPDKLSITWIKNSYQSGALTPEELINEIIRRADEMKEKNIWITEPSHEITDKYVQNLPKDRENYNCPKIS